MSSGGNATVKERAVIERPFLIREDSFAKGTLVYTRVSAGSFLFDNVETNQNLPT